CRNATSLNRRRCRTFARSTWAAVEIPAPCNATSATDRLPVDCIGLSWPFRRYGELLKPPPGPSTSRLSAGTGRSERAPVRAPFQLPSDQLVTAKRGLPLVSLISLDQVFSTSFTTLAGIGT